MDLLLLSDTLACVSEEFTSMCKEREDGEGAGSHALVVNPKKTLERLLHMPVTVCKHFAKQTLRERLRHMPVTVCKHFSRLQSMLSELGPM